MVKGPFDQLFHCILCGCTPEGPAVMEPPNNALRKDRARRDHEAWIAQLEKRRNTSTPRSLAATEPLEGEGEDDGHDEDVAGDAPSGAQSEQPEILSDPSGPSPVVGTGKQKRRSSSEMIYGFMSAKVAAARGSMHGKDKDEHDAEAKSGGRSSWFGSFHVPHGHSPHNSQGEEKEGGKRPGGWFRTSVDSKEKNRREVIRGEEAYALFPYYANHGSAPFPPDPRKELDLRRGQRVDLLDMRHDGWCVVRKPTGDAEYYVPGNYITVDHHTPYFQGPM